MKIAVFHNLPLGGAKRVVDEQIKALSQKHEVEVFKLSFSLQGGRLKKDFDNFFTLAQKHKNLAQKIDNKAFDAILIHPDRLIQAPFVLRYLKTPTLYYCEELLRIAYEKELAFKEKVFWGKKIYELLTRALRKKIDKDSARCADTIFVNSEYTQKKVKMAYDRESIICHPGVDTKKFKSPARGTGRQNSKVKSESQLLFIGKPLKINGYPLAKQVSELTNIKLKVIHGYKLSDKKLAKEYATSIATLCLSYNEPFGLTSIESMACETPVLAVDDGGYKETVVDSVTGFLLKRSPKLFAEKLNYLIKNPNIAKKMGKAGREHVKENFSWKKHNKKLVEEMFKLVKSVKK